MPLPLVGASSRHGVPAAATTTPTLTASDRSKDATRGTSRLAARDVAGCMDDPGAGAVRVQQKGGKALNSRQKTDVYASVRMMPRLADCRTSTPGNGAPDGRRALA